MYLFYLGLVFWAFAFLWVYPLFQEPDFRMGGAFAFLAFCFYFLYMCVSKPEKEEETSVYKLVKSLYLSVCVKF